MNNNRASVAKKFALWYRLKFEGLDKSPKGTLTIGEISQTAIYFMMSMPKSYPITSISQWVEDAKTHALLIIAEEAISQ